MDKHDMNYASSVLEACSFAALLTGVCSLPAAVGAGTPGLRHLSTRRDSQREGVPVAIRRHHQQCLAEAQEPQQLRQTTYRLGTVQRGNLSN